LPPEGKEGRRDICKLYERNSKLSFMIRKRRTRKENEPFSGRRKGVVAA